MTLSLIPTNTNNTIIQATNVNQVVNVLQQPAGGQEKGHYIIAGPGYATNANVSWYFPSLSRNTTPVSVSVDSTDIAATGFSSSTPSADKLTANGFHVGNGCSSAQPNAIEGGNYTIQY